jgi:hypothetical protein
MRWHCSGIVSVVLIAAVVVPVTAIAQTEAGPIARIAVLRPHDGKTTDFEAGYIRHLEWHERNKDPFAWFGWSIWAGERQRWFVYATFGHSPQSLGNPVNPADDELDNVLNVVPHAEFISNSIYEFLPALSRGTGVPRPLARVELTLVDLELGAAKAFEALIGAEQSRLKEETLWYRLVAGGKPPRYLRLRPRANLAAVIDARGEQALPEKANSLVKAVTVDILSLRQNLSYNLPPAS